MVKRKVTGSRHVRRLNIVDLLSFADFELELAPLNVIVGPNGSGKSNLIEILSLMRSTAGDLQSFVRRSGGIDELIWKGAEVDEGTVLIDFDNAQGDGLLSHKIRLAGPGPGYSISDEEISFSDGKKRGVAYGRTGGKHIIRVAGRGARVIDPEHLNASQSIVSQRRDPESFPEITYIADVYDRIRVYREWAFGRNTVFREPQKADMRNDRLEEDFSNLGLVLNRLRRTPKAKAAVLSGLRDLYDGLDDFDVSVEAGSVQVFLTEGDYTIPANRLSDGTLRYLCLLAILCDPERVWPLRVTVEQG